MGKSVSRHLYYAWIEFQGTADGRMFAAGMDRLGWKNLLRELPRGKDPSGTKRVDAAHPLLPIRRRGGALLALPNEWELAMHGKKLIDRPNNDAVYAEFLAGPDAAEFGKRINERNASLARWVFSPGVTASAPKQLTSGADAAARAELVGISGHGNAGQVWGGGSPVLLGETLRLDAGPSHDPGIKYLVIASCYNVHKQFQEAFLPAFRRRVPLRGMFGYNSTYNGGRSGGAVQAAFTAGLKKKGTTLLDAWRKAQKGLHAKTWSAFVHKGALGDTLEDWVAGKLSELDPRGEVLYFTADNFGSGGEELVERTPWMRGDFVMLEPRSAEINRSNSMLSNVGLFPGKKGMLQFYFTDKRVSFRKGEKFQVTVYCIRPQKEVDLDRTLELTQPKGAKLSLLRDRNKQNKTRHADGFEVEILADELDNVFVDYTVKPEALKFYKQVGRNDFGRFWLGVTSPHSSAEFPLTVDGAFLRPTPTP